MTEEILNNLEKNILHILQTQIKDIIEKTRKNMIVVEEKSDGDSATIADVQIGELCDNILPTLLPNSIVIQEESFNENVYKKFIDTKYVWVIDPIDGTKAFRDTSNSEWCVGICLLENLTPILSFVYIVENWLDKPYLISANKYRTNLFDFGNTLIPINKLQDYKYVSHIHRDTERNDTENKIAILFKNNETIRAYAGHSTLAQFTEVAIDTKKVFTRRGANIWDIIQGAYLIQKNGGEVFYENGENIFPLNPQMLTFKDNHLIMPFTIACSLELKSSILKQIKN